MRMNLKLGERGGAKQIKYVVSLILGLSAWKLGVYLFDTFNEFYLLKVRTTVLYVVLS